ncbi:MAG TPA: hypothetical protein VGC32_03335 [Solirubrobacterales bacterium]
MTLLAKMVSGLLGHLLLIAFGVAGIGAAVFCIQGGTDTLSAAHLAELLSLEDLRDTLGSWFADLEADGPTAVAAAICGAGAVALGLFLLVGALVPRRDRLYLIDDDQGDAGAITARRRAIASAIAEVAERPRDVLGAKVRVAPRRSGPGGRARIRLLRSRSTDDTDRAQEAWRDLERLEGDLSLRASVRSRLPRRGGRVI